jgi:DNA-directed RNA polymerase specialized sigma subunit
VYRTTERTREWRERNPEEYRRQCRKAHLKRRYGMTLEEYDELFEAQNGICAICLEAEATDVDHEKPSGRIRGLLCHRCNWAMGIFGDNANRLRSAANYLEEKK